MLTDWLTHTWRRILAKTLCVLKLFWWLSPWQCNAVQPTLSKYDWLIDFLSINRQISQKPLSLWLLKVSLHLSWQQRRLQTKTVITWQKLDHCSLGQQNCCRNQKQHYHWSLSQMWVFTSLCSLVSLYSYCWHTVFFSSDCWRYSRNPWWCWGMAWRDCGTKKQWVSCVYFFMYY